MLQQQMDKYLQLARSVQRDGLYIRYSYIVTDFLFGVSVFKLNGPSPSEVIRVNVQVKSQVRCDFTQLNLKSLNLTQFK